MSTTILKAETVTHKKNMSNNNLKHVVNSNIKDNTKTIKKKEIDIYTRLKDKNEFLKFLPSINNSNERERVRILFYFYFRTISSL